MEEFRRKLLGEQFNLYPDLGGELRKPLQPHVASKPQLSDEPSIISVSSDGSSGASTMNSKQWKSSPAIIISDSEDDEVQVLGPSVHIEAQGKRRLPSASKSKHAIPVHVPSNKDLRAIVPFEREYEMLDMHGADNLHDPMLTTAEAERALRELVTGAYTHEIEVSLKDATVEGFRPNVKLLPHQISGRSWMAGRELGKKMGGILADDMGLGKTIQTITRILDGRATQQDKKEGWSPTTLVICPVAVISQWANEIKKIAVGLTVIEHHGASRTSDPKVLEKAHVVITSYSTVTSEYNAYNPASDEGSSSKKKGKKQSSDDSDDDSVIRKMQIKTSRRKEKDAIFRVRWWRIVLDEAHNIKNRNAKSSIACCALEGKFRWCLTGTPMQNNVEELFPLLKFLKIRPLNEWHTFNEQIAKPVKANRTVRAMKRLHVVLGAVMLRRTKDTLVNGKPILTLPERVVEIVDCEFDADERAFYNTVQDRVQSSLEALEKQGGAARNYTSMLVLLLRLRQACNHPSLVSADYVRDKEAVEPKQPKSQDDEEEDADELAERLALMGIATTKRCQLCQTLLNTDNTAKSGTCTSCAAVVAEARTKSRRDSDLPPDSTKIRKILEILQGIDELSEGTEKTIIFSQFTSMLDLIEPFLRAEKIKFVRYDGTMNKAEREYALDRIKESRSIRVILISFKAGSTGLNLTCCNHVILVDPWWNPALEDQAFDRAHRFGQTRDVHIRKLCVPDTTEQRILELQDKKRALAKAALSGDRMKNMRLGADELIALFKPGGRDDDED